MKKSRHIQHLKAGMVFLLLSFAYSIYAQTATTQSFSFSGAVQTFTVPSCVSSITLEAYGAQGASTTPGGTPGLGGYARETISVTAGQVLYIYVGGQNGYNGGGIGGVNGNSVSSTSSTGLSGNGGGASDIRIGGTALSNRVLVAGGGGGPGHNGTWTNCQTAGPAGNGGAGGGLVGGAGSGGSSTACNCTGGGGNGGGGGTATLGGAAGTYNNSGCLQGWGIGSAGTLGQGGNGSTVYYNGTGGGGGGGGGYYGGGCGASGSDTTQGGGGGGGSSYVSVTTNTLTTAGVRFGDGLVVFSYNFNGQGVTVTPASSVICNGTSVTLIASGVPTFTWSNGSNASSITVNPSTTTSYTVQGTNTLSCISSSVITLTVSAGLPVLSVTSSTNQTCLGKTATLTASGALSYTWSNNVTNGASFNPSVTTTYTVLGSNGCGTSSAVTTISISPLPVSAISSTNTVCAGSNVTLTAVSAATSFSWQPFGLTGASVVVSPTATTVYTVSVSDGTCSGQTNVTVTTLQIPTITINASSTVACQGVPVTLAASGGISYTWTPGGTNGSTISVTPASPTMYSVAASNALGCVAGANQVILVTASPTVNITSLTNIICNGDALVLTASGGNNYVWSNGATGPSVSVSPTISTTYSVVATNSNNCSTMQSMLVQVISPVVTITSPTAICYGANAQLVLSGATSFTWSTGSVFNNITVSPTVTTTYSVSAFTATNSLNCPSTAFATILVNPTPTVTTQSTRTVICKNESITLTASGANTYSWTSTSAVTSGSSVVVTSSLITTLNYTVTGTNTFGCSAFTLAAVKVIACTSLGENTPEDLHLTVYPNPNGGEFDVVYHQPVRLTLVSELGQEIRVIELNAANNYRQTLSGLSPGVYFVTGNKKALNQKVIVSN